MKGRRGNPGLKGRLVDKSVEAYILALETINRISIQYRIETFCYLICNAWELLLKAKIIEDTRKTNSIYYKTQRENPKRSLSLQDCLERIMPSEKDPIRRNVERVKELRDEATHLVIGQIPSEQYFGQSSSRPVRDGAIVAKVLVIGAGFFQAMPVG